MGISTYALHRTAQKREREVPQQTGRRQTARVGHHRQLCRAASVRFFYLLCTVTDRTHCTRLSHNKPSFQFENLRSRNVRLHSLVVPNDGEPVHSPCFDLVRLNQTNLSWPCAGRKEKEEIIFLDVLNPIFPFLKRELNQIAGRWTEKKNKKKNKLGPSSCWPLLLLRRMILGERFKR